MFVLFCVCFQSMLGGTTSRTSAEITLGPQSLFVSGGSSMQSLPSQTTPAPMQDALRLSMGSFMGFCRCECMLFSIVYFLLVVTIVCLACEQVIGDLIDNLEDDFPGRTYQEGDVYALINDRFCYGVRWVFRSSVRTQTTLSFSTSSNALIVQCRYILSKYMDETIQLLMMEASEREVCETLRFCW